MTPEEVRSLVQRELSARADAEKAAQMQAYVKTNMPFYGVTKPQIRDVHRQLHAAWQPVDAGSWKAVVLHLWQQPHREEKFVALQVLSKHRRFHTPAAVPLMERLIREGAWWDLVDEVVTQSFSPLLLNHREELLPTVERWIHDEDVWIRRAALISQLKHRDKTDLELLFRFCRLRAHETVFWTRKAIGWALREAAKHHPQEVRAFLDAHGHELSGLSYREASKHLSQS